jgi:2-succinyl-5-enolpyruvyl-6-hydroxy-3-cyclohexene-1-carboxylate synthase
MTMGMGEIFQDKVAAAKAEDARRVAKRQRVLKTAKIVLDDWRAIDCTLRDVSETGAKIIVDSTGHIPEKFRLFLSSDNTIRDVQIAWKQHNMLGVHFSSEPKSCGLRKF